MYSNKENSLDGLLDAVDNALTNGRDGKHMRKLRSKSLGVGLLESNKESSSTNRRKSVLVHRSATGGGDDEEAKRREARRKSLANRRVSFAPEATLHTWDVLEHFRDVSELSASSGSAKGGSRHENGSSSSQPRPGDLDDGPSSSPLKEAPDDEIQSSDSEDQQNRILDFGPLDDSGSDDAGSPESRGAGGNDEENDGDMTMEIANDEITAAFKPWIQKNRLIIQPSASSSFDPFTSPRNGQHHDFDDDSGDDMTMDMTRPLGTILSQARRQSNVTMVDGDMSMDMTQAIGGILAINSTAYAGNAKESPVESKGMPTSGDGVTGSLSDQDAGDESLADMSMDLTRVVGGILDSIHPNSADAQQSPGKRVSLKRRVSELSAAYGMKSVESVGRAPKRRLTVDSLGDDGGMDQTMDLTVALGGIKPASSPIDSPDQGDDMTLGDEAMDMTMAIGGILRRSTPSRPKISDRTESDEDISMEMTGVLGQINSIPLAPFQSHAAKADDTRSGGSKETRRSSPLVNGSLAPPHLEKEVMNKTPEMPTSRSSRPSLLDTPFKTAEEPFYPAVPQYILSFSPSRSTSDRRQSSSNTVLDGLTPKRSPKKGLKESPDKTRRQSGSVGPSPVVGKSPEKASDRKRDQGFSDQPTHLVSLQPEKANLLDTRLESNSSLGSSNGRTGAGQNDAKPEDVSPVRPSAMVQSVGPAESTVPVFPPPEPLETQAKGMFGGKGYATSVPESLRLLSTPTKAPLSPQKLRSRRSIRPPERVSPPKPVASPAVLSPLKRRQSPTKKAEVQFTAPSPVKPAVPDEEDESELVHLPPEEKITLTDFLSLTKIRFLELSSASKRRHTAAPSGLGRNLLAAEDEEDDVRRLQARAAAAACTVPLLSLFQHSCQEMRHYIAGGKDEVREIEAEAFENQPPLFSEYLAAPPTERAIMDNQFKNMKTNARLQSKDGWYGWRMQLLHDLMNGLNQTAADLDKDEATISSHEALLQTNLPALQAHHDRLLAEANRLKERAVQFAGTDKKELQAARKDLIQIDGEIHSQQARLDNLRRSVGAKREKLKQLAAEKEDCMNAIDAARQAVEGVPTKWTAARVKSLKDRVDEFTASTGWAISTCSRSSRSPGPGAATTAISLTYRSDLELTFHPSAFYRPSLTFKNTSKNLPIRLIYIGDTPAVVTPPLSASLSLSSSTSRRLQHHQHYRRPRPLTTSGRFILQLLQLQLQSLSQPTVTVRSMLDFVSQGWDLAVRVSESARLLRQSFVTQESIVADDRLSLTSSLIMPSLTTKILVTVDINPVVTVVANSQAIGRSNNTASPSPSSSPATLDISVFSSVSCTVCYGERYDEVKLADFLTTHMFASLPKAQHLPDPPVMASAISALKLRLLSRGKQRAGGTHHPGAGNGALNGIGGSQTSGASSLSASLSSLAAAPSALSASHHSSTEALATTPTGVAPPAATTTTTAKAKPQPKMIVTTTPATDSSGLAREPSTQPSAAAAAAPKALSIGTLTAMVVSTPTLDADPLSAISSTQELGHGRFRGNEIRRTPPRPTEGLSESARSSTTKPGDGANPAFGSAVGPKATTPSKFTPPTPGGAGTTSRARPNHSASLPASSSSAPFASAHPNSQPAKSPGPKPRAIINPAGPADPRVLRPSRIAVPTTSHLISNPAAGAGSTANVTVT